MIRAPARTWPPHVGYWQLATAVVALSFAVGYMIPRQPALGIAPLAVPAGLYLLLRPGVAVALLVFWVLTHGWLTADLQVLPDATKWLREALLAIIVSAAAFRLVSHQTTWRRTPFALPIGLFVGLAATSALLNQSSPTGLVLYVRYFLQYTLLFYALVHLDLDARYYRRLFIGMFAWAVAQVFLAVYQSVQRTVTAPDAFRGGNFDFTVGTLGPSQGDGLGYLLLGVLITVWALSGERLRVPVAVSLLLFIPLVISTSRTIMFVTPFFFFWIHRRRLVSPDRTVVAWIGGISLTGAAAAAYFAQAVDVDVSRIFTPWGALASQFILESGQFFGRFGWTGHIMAELSSRPLGLLFGAGPGAFLSFAAFSDPAGLPPLAMRTAIEFGVDPTTGSGMAGGSSDLNVLFAELGLLGLAAIAFVLWRAVCHVRMAQERALDPYSRGLARAGGYVVLLMAIGTVFYPSWEVPYLAAPFWLLMAAIDRHARTAPSV